MATTAADFYPLGISIVCDATATPATELEAFLKAHTAGVEQVCLAVRHDAQLAVARAAGPKVRAQRVASPETGWETASSLAQCTWTLVLHPQEHLDAPSLANLRRALPAVVGSMAVTIGGQIRLWRTGFGLSFDGAAGVRALRDDSILPQRTISAEALPAAPDAFAALHADLGKAPPSGPVLITGMHRSGTSTIARVINLLGVSLGNQLEGVDTEAHPSNPKGHWEDLDARGLNVSLLHMAHGQALAGEWVVDATVPAPNPGAPHVQAAKRQLERLSGTAQGASRWGFKDPRTCLTMDVWHAAAPDACVVLCVRDPLSAATSLQALHGVSVRDGLRLWAAYNLRALESCAARGIPLLVCSFERLLSDSAAEVARLASFLGCARRLDAETQAQVEGFLERDLRHHVAPKGLAPALAAALGDQAVNGEVDALLALHSALETAAEQPVAAYAAAG